MKSCAIKVYAIFILAALLFGAALVFAPVSYASAAQTHKVVTAPVSNLAGNEYAGRSIVALCVKDDTVDLNFYIPESYCLLDPTPHRVPGYYVVEYAGTKFNVEAKYIETDTDNFIQDVAFEDGEQLFPDIQLTLKEGVTVQVDGVSVGGASHQIKFLGYSEDGAQYYVSAASLNSDKVYGFIPADSVEDFNVPYQAKAQKERDALLAQNVMPKPESGDIVPNTSLALRIVMILGICIPALLITVLLFKPTKKRAKQFSSRAESDYDKGREY